MTMSKSRPAVMPVTVIVIAWILGGCSMSNINNPIAEKLELDSRTRQRFHHLAEWPFGDELVRPGFIVAIEKSPKPKVNNGGLSAYGEHVQFPPGNGNDYEEQKKKFDEIVSGETDMFVSHIAGYNLRSRADGEARRFLYNIYPNFGSEVHDITPGATQSYAQRGWLALQNELREAVRAEIKAASGARPYTHLIISSMGWDNDQVESIQHYNAIVGNLIAAARRAGDSGQKFSPLLVGVTWPSVWGWPSWFDLGALIYKLFSYGVKADDADEIGVTLANWLVNELGTDAKKYAADVNAPLKVVALGHSFGARLISRAVFSNQLLRDNKTGRAGSPVDLLIGLQGAFSVNRFIIGQGNEGAPYAAFRDYTKSGLRVVMTWSTKDTANPLSTYISGSPHIGGELGYKEATEKTRSGEAKGVFQFVSIGSDVMLKPDMIQDTSRIIYVDASKFVDDHNDILDHQIGRFLWSTFDLLAPAPK